MKIQELLKNKQSNLVANKPVTIAFIGDSVTQGCFECYTTSPTSLETVFDYKSAYSTRVREILNLLYPNVQVNIINSGISGDSAPVGAERFERDVLSYNPDLVVISYGLNDSGKGREGLGGYKAALEEMFAKLQEKEIDCIFLTQNVMNSWVSPHLKDELLKGLAESFAANVQNNGVLHEYFQTAKEACAKYGVRVCDLHAVWERMIALGVNTTELLANKLNHPIRELHYYMAIKLVETMLLP